MNLTMRNFILSICIILFYQLSNSQELKRDMISSQGTSVLLESGHYVTQTVGQQTITGNSYGQNKVIQGFQQPYWNYLISNSEVLDSIEINHYPNPVITNLNFNFSNYNDGVTNVLVFDFSGRLVMERTLKVESGTAQLNLSSIPSGSYLVYLRNNKLNYYTKIIKK